MPSEKAKMLDGERYDATDPELVAERQRASERTSEFDRTTPDEAAERVAILRELFGSTAEVVRETEPR